MKNLIAALLVGIFSLVNAKAQGIVDSIAVQTCDCVGKVKNNGNIEEFHMRLGLCILEKSQPYQAELKRDYKIDFGKSNAGKKLGELIGVRMAFYCPETILKLAQADDKPSAGKSVEEFFSIEGKISDIQTEQFLTVKIQTSEGKTYSLLWLYFFDNSAKLMKEKSELLGKKVKISFIEQELYDARTKEYRKFKIIKELEME